MTELWFPTVTPRWLSSFGTGTYKLSAKLADIDTDYQGCDAARIERAFYRAALRTVLRRWLPWIARPVAELHFEWAER